MTVIDVNDVGPKLKSLLDNTQPGDEVLVSVDGKTVARIATTAAARQCRSSVTSREVRMADDFDVLPPEELAEWEK